MKERGGSAAAAGQCARRRSEGSSVPCGLLKVILSVTVEESETVEESSGGTLQQKGGSLQWKRKSAAETGSLQRNRKPATEVQARGVYLGPCALAWLGAGAPECKGRGICRTLR